MLSKPQHLDISKPNLQYIKHINERSNCLIIKLALQSYLIIHNAECTYLFMSSSTIRHFAFSCQHGSDKILKRQTFLWPAALPIARPNQIPDKVNFSLHSDTFPNGGWRQATKILICSHHMVSRQGHTQEFFHFLLTKFTHKALINPDLYYKTFAQGNMQ